MKQANMGHFFIKVFILTCILVGVFQLWENVWGEKIQNNKQETSGDVNAQLQSAYAASVANAGVAISTRIGINFDSQKAGGIGRYYEGVEALGSTPEERQVQRARLLSENMLIIGEYLNLSRTNIKDALDSSPDRQKTLENFISQLENRYKNSALSITQLQKHKDLLLTDLNRLDAEIESTKTQMESSFAASQTPQTLAATQEYFHLRDRYTQSFTDIVFINQFLQQHSFLNRYNTGILDTLINNKQALINESYVVIPDSGDQYLRPLELIFDEAEMKSQ